MVSAGPRVIGASNGVSARRSRRQPEAPRRPLGSRPGCTAIAPRPRDLLRSTHTADRLIAQELLHGIRIDFIAHWRIDHAWAYGVDANSSCSVVQGGALGQADHAVLACVIGGTARQADEPAER